MRASLIPKLRDHFAEFLNQGSLKRLSLLDPTTCVGLRYGLQVLNSIEAFLGSMESITSNVKLRHHCLGLKRKRICLFPKPTHLHQHIQQLADLSFCVPPSLKRCRYRNINLFSIDYAFRPRLRNRLTLAD